MKDKPYWAGLTYVDLFAGPGMCRVRNTGEEIDGSPLIALGSPKPFDEFFFVDTSREAAKALESRFTCRNAHVQPHIYTGDCNREVDKLVRDVPSDHLVLAFVDPTGLHVHFDTIRKLTSGRKVDLIISFMDRLDLVRNVGKYYYENEDSNIDKFLGRGVDWRRKFDSLSNQDAQHVCHMFLDLYSQQLKSIGYQHFGQPQRISGSGSPFYLLLFASKHHLGADIWNRVSKKDRGGQGSFEF